MIDSPWAADDEFPLGDEFVEGDPIFLKDDHGRWWEFMKVPGRDAATLTYDDGAASYSICFDT